jgi:acyl-coenzyme A synthetase/AMP-(fatty) acid ligase
MAETTDASDSKRRSSGPRLVIRRFVKDRVAAYKYPRHVWFEDALPKGPTGKIVRREIKPPSLAGPS